MQSFLELFLIHEVYNRKSLIQVKMIRIWLTLIAALLIMPPAFSMYATGNSYKVDQLLGQGVELLNTKKYDEAMTIFNKVMSEPNVNASTIRGVHALRASAYLGLNQYEKALEEFVYNVDLTDQWSVQNFYFYCSKIADNQVLMDEATSILAKPQFEFARELFAKEFFERKELLDCLVILSEAAEDLTNSELYLKALHSCGKSERATLLELIEKNPKASRLKTWRKLSLQLGDTSEQ